MTDDQDQLAALDAAEVERIQRMARAFTRSVNALARIAGEPPPDDPRDVAMRALADVAGILKPPPFPGRIEIIREPDA